MLSEVERDIWVADGPSVPFFGFRYPTRMTVVRLADGGLWVCSPIALSPPLAEAVNVIGPVRHLVSPNKIHHLFLGGLGAGVARRQALRLAGLSTPPSRFDVRPRVGGRA